jgi:hypothetical protein
MQAETELPEKQTAFQIDDGDKTAANDDVIYSWHCSRYSKSLH